MAESAFAKHLSGDVGFRQPEKQGSASKGVSGKDGLDGESWGMPGEAGSDGLLFYFYLGRKLYCSINLKKQGLMELQEQMDLR